MSLTSSAFARVVRIVPVRCTDLLPNLPLEDQDATYGGVQRTVAYRRPAVRAHPALRPGPRRDRSEGARSHAAPSSPHASPAATFIVMVFASYVEAVEVMQNSIRPASKEQLDLARLTGCDVPPGAPLLIAAAYARPSRPSDG